jgi:DNA polymerase I-like protein with 3'-5' exonuclease and polymerase domains
MILLVTDSGKGILNNTYLGFTKTTLDNLCKTVGIPLTNVKATSVFRFGKSFPIGKTTRNRFKPLPSFDEAKADTLTHIRELCQLYPITVIVPICEQALQILTGLSSVDKYQGSLLNSPDIDIPIMPCTPLQRVIGNNEYIYVLQNNFSKIRKVMEGTFEPSNRDFLLDPTYLDCLAFLEKALTKKVVSIDIEVIYKEMSCIGISIAEPANDCINTTICIPFIKDSKPNYSISETVDIFNLLATLLESKNIKKVFHNAAFDTTFLYSKYGLITNNIDDTMVMHAILYPDFKKGLDNLTRLHTNENYYKDDGKEYFKEMDNQTSFWIYNCKDASITLECYHYLLTELDRQGNIPTYNRQVSIIPILIYMSVHGTNVDIDNIEKKRRIVKRRLEKRIVILDKLTNNPGMNYQSPKQLMDYFYTSKGIKPYVNRKSGKPSIDEKALIRLAIKYKEAKMLLRYREDIKLFSTYLNVLLKDGRMVCSYNPVGTIQGRLSSSADIFGYGSNRQNQPSTMKSLFIVDKGHIRYMLDLSQAENRIVAYQGNVAPMIEAFENGEDIHMKTASLIYNKPIDAITDNDRQMGKKANHGLNYDLGYRSFSLIYIIPETEAKFIVNSYHMAYPGIRNTFHREIVQGLRTHRSVTNLMGRRRIFLASWGDDLFKQAYSFIPQSTVADIINEKGLAYIWNSEDPDMLRVSIDNQIHDSIEIDIPTDMGVDRHVKLLWSIKESLETPLRTAIHTFTIPVSIKAGLSSKGGKELKVIKSKEHLRQYIAEVFKTYGD